MSIAFFILGEPGVGKTTTVRHLVPELLPDSSRTRTEIEKPKWTICGTTVLAGHYRGQTFDGADTVPYTGAKAALEYWREHLLPRAELTIFDGDRFSTQPSLDFVRATGVTVVGARLMLPEGVIEKRRAERGSKQNETWLKGRATKVMNFAAKIEAFPVSTSFPPAQVAGAINSWLDSVRAEVRALEPTRRS